jgi:hypothetical protein
MDLDPFLDFLVLAGVDKQLEAEAEAAGVGHSGRAAGWLDPDTRGGVCAPSLSDGPRGPASAQTLGSLGNSEPYCEPRDGFERRYEPLYGYEGPYEQYDEAGVAGAWAGHEARGGQVRSRFAGYGRHGQELPYSHPYRLSYSLREGLEALEPGPYRGQRPGPPRLPAWTGGEGVGGGAHGLRHHPYRPSLDGPKSQTSLEAGAFPSSTSSPAAPSRAEPVGGPGHRRPASAAELPLQLPSAGAGRGLQGHRGWPPGLLDRRTAPGGAVDPLMALRAARTVRGGGAGAAAGLQGPPPLEGGVAWGARGADEGPGWAKEREAAAAAAAMTLERQPRAEWELQALAAKVGGGGGPMAVHGSRIAMRRCGTGLQRRLATTAGRTPRGGGRPCSRVLRRGSQPRRERPGPLRVGWCAVCEALTRGCARVSTQARSLSGDLAAMMQAQQAWPEAQPELQAAASRAHYSARIAQAEAERHALLAELGALGGAGTLRGFDRRLDQPLTLEAIVSSQLMGAAALAHAGTLQAGGGGAVTTPAGWGWGWGGQT